MGGVYILLIALPREETIPVGKLGPIRFPEGFYAYVGSAMNGLESRVTRHLRRKNIGTLTIFWRKPRFGR
jgi:sugar fermentation stimulation protein A